METYHLAFPGRRSGFWRTIYILASAQTAARSFLCDLGDIFDSIFLVLFKIDGLEMGRIPESRLGVGDYTGGIHRIGIYI